MAKEIDISLAVIKEMYPGYFDDPDKLQALGCDYANGEGVEQNIEIARALWEKAAEMGDIGSMTHLGNLYYLADYEGHDEETAFEWYWEAGNNGDDEALFMLGVFFDKGYFVNKDEAMAFYYYKLSAYRGLMAAQFNVGWDYQYGVGVPHNYKLAAKWYQLACKQGSEDAMNQLGQMYADGLGVQKDEKEAFRLVSASALKEDLQAMVALGDFYELGIGCERSNEKALEWYLKAKENGNDPKERIIKLKKYDFAYIKAFKKGEVYELPGNTNWMRLWKYIALNLKQSQVFFHALLNQRIMAKIMDKTWPQKDMDDICKEEYYNLFSHVNLYIDFKLAVKSMYRYLPKYDMEWLIIKHCSRFMDENRQVVQKLAKDLNLKVIVIC